ncbi:unnamed protein product [Amaranthus hypochondriacus]
MIAPDHEKSKNSIFNPTDTHLEVQISESPTPTSQTAEQHPFFVEQDYESICWGCGLRLILPSNAPVFKCGWCGAITKQNENKREGKNLQWRLLRDRCFVSVLLIFMIFIICGGLWAVYPVVFSVSYLCGVFHCTVTFLLSLFTISTFGLAAFSDAGTPSPVMWGSYPAVRKDELLDYTFCQYCSKPKSPRAHHCSSCGKCVLDMDHHCPFIGNCVGASNHRYFISFLFAAIISVTYAAIMSAYGVLHVLPSLADGAVQHIQRVDSKIAFISILKEICVAFLTSAVFFSARGLVLLYLFVASISVGIGLTVLLWQQLYFIFEGRTYLTSLNSQVEVQRDCRNLYLFFGFPYSCPQFLRGFCNSKKIHSK